MSRDHSVNLTFDGEVSARLDDFSKREGTTRTAVARRALLRELGFLDGAPTIQARPPVDVNSIVARFLAELKDAAT